MAGNRLVDAAKLLNASIAVAKQHIVLRSRQLDTFNKTSSLAKAVKSQTDRVTLTAKAASALAQRLSESQALAPGAVRPAERQRQQHAEYVNISPSGRQEVDSSSKQDREEGLNQDHHYGPSESNTVDEPVPKSDLKARQDKPETPALPDGSIPVPNPEIVLPDRGKDTYSKRPVPESAKQPLDGAQTGNDAGFEPVASDASTIPSPSSEISFDPETKKRTGNSSTDGSPKTAAIDSEGSDQNASVSFSKRRLEGMDTINTDVFRTSRVSKMLAGIGGSANDVSRSESIASRLKQPSTSVSNVLPPETSSHSPNGSMVSSSENQPPVLKPEVDAETGDLAEAVSGGVHTISNSESEASAQVASMDTTTSQMRESRVSSSRLARLWQYGELATSLALGAVGERLRRGTGGGTSQGSLLLSPSNIERLVAKLSRMRGAALKVGQMISFQDMKMLPAEVHEILKRVQDSANYMPQWQRDEVLSTDLGADWRSIFGSFEDMPVAAASIGQVHRATLASTGQTVAVKVQYPGVADSIDSDLNNISILLTASRLLPRGLYLDKTIANARVELAWECDYIREAECAKRFRTLLADDTDVFTVPAVIPEASGPKVLTAEYMSGTAVTKYPTLSQAQRDWIGTQILRLCLREIFEFRFMQSDPNWTNFLFNAGTQKLELLDFGASRDYPEEFIEHYVSNLSAAVQGDRDAVHERSLQLGYLTGHESQKMIDAHITSVMTLAEPFRSDGPAVYDFQDQTITDRIRGLIPVMLRERLAPPPEETYSLHRKLSGAFLLCARLGSRVKCRELFHQAMDKWERAHST